MNYRTEYIDNLLLSGESSITLKTKMGEDYPTKSWELVLEDDEKEKKVFCCCVAMAIVIRHIYLPAQVFSALFKETFLA